jgi:hypothetical protein
MLAGWRRRAQELRGDVIALTWRAAAPACGGTPRRSLRSSSPMLAVRSISSLTFIPVLGYLDGLVLLPIGVLLAVKMIPAELHCRHRLDFRQPSWRASSSVA